MWATGSLSFLTSENAKWYSHFGRQFEISYKSKHTLTMWSSRHTPDIYSNELKILYPHKNLPNDVYKAALFITDKTCKHQDIF